MAKKNVEINVKTQNGYDQLYPINDTVVAYDMMSVEPDHRIKIEPSDWIWLSDSGSKLISFNDITNDYIPIVEIMTDENFSFQCRANNTSVTLTAYGDHAPTQPMYITTLMGVKPSNKTFQYPYDNGVTAVRGKKSITKDVWELNATDLTNFKTQTSGFVLNDTSHVDFFASSDMITIIYKRYNTLLDRINLVRNREGVFVNTDMSVGNIPSTLPISFSSYRIIIGENECIAGRHWASFANDVWTRGVDYLIPSNATSATLIAYKLL